MIATWFVRWINTGSNFHWFVGASVIVSIIIVFATVGPEVV